MYSIFCILGIVWILLLFFTATIFVGMFASKFLCLCYLYIFDHEMYATYKKLIRHNTNIYLISSDSYSKAELNHEYHTSRFNTNVVFDPNKYYMIHFAGDDINSKDFSPSVWHGDSKGSNVIFTSFYKPCARALMKKAIVID